MDWAQIEEAASAIEPVCGAEPPQVGVVLGSGLGGFADGLEQCRKISYGEIPHAPRSSVAGHPGNLVLGRHGQVRVACLQGRVHLYEGVSVDSAVFGVRLLARLGCKAIIVTNAAGGISEQLRPGDLMLISDHLNLTGHNPLVGPTPPHGPRFPDMTEAYSRSLAEFAEQAAAELGITLPRGVYAGLLGPSYETPAEIRMLERLGADAVGMSTVLEVIALRQLAVPVVAISCITNLAAGRSGALLDHDDVQRVAAEARTRFTKLLGRLIELCAT